jgi:hypothetical protein
MKDYPKYVSFKYYYRDKTTSKELEFRDWKNDKISLCGSLMFTEDFCVYFKPMHGSLITPDELHENRRRIPYDWLTIEQIQYAIDCQPYDFDDTWSKGSMYSKDLWKLIIEDMKVLMRDFKIDTIIDKKINWVGYLDI